MTASDSSTQRTVSGSERATGVIDWPAVRQANRSCCCIAPPSVVVVLQPTHDRPHPTEVLLCGHHFDHSRSTLQVSGALAFSLDGEHLTITTPQPAGVNPTAVADQPLLPWYIRTMINPSDPGAAQHPHRVRCTGTVRLPPGVAAPLSLFTPEGERAWAAGWDPQYPARAADDSEPGTVFQTRHGAHLGTWIVASREPGRSIRYTRVIADQDAGTVTVTLDSETQVTVGYDLTALSEPGAAHLAQFAASYPQFLAHWEQAIAAALTTAG